jgi:hypothetical protein
MDIDLISLGIDPLTKALMELILIEVLVTVSYKMLHQSVMERRCVLTW